MHTHFEYQSLTHSIYQTIYSILASYIPHDIKVREREKIENFTLRLMGTGNRATRRLSTLTK